MTNRHPGMRSPLELAAAVLVTAFAVAVSLFAIRSNDVWWMLAVGRYLLETKSFIYTDPFTFTLAGVPWSPQSWLAAIVFYLVHAAAGPAGLVLMRALIVGAVFAVTLAALARARVSWAAVSPLAVLVLLTVNTRFLVRAHLFEYLFIAVTMAFLLTAQERRGWSFFMIPIAMQVLWTNTHPSFLLGPALVGLYFLGEWIGECAGARVPSWGVRTLYRHDYRRAALLVAGMLLACLVNPAPMTFLAQPLGTQQRELLARFTLEWRSPFDPAIAGAIFHPWYEILLAVSAAALVLNARRLPPAALFLLVGTALLSLQSHRFRVEFALVALPVVAVLLRDAPVTAVVVSRLGATRARAGLVVAAGALIVATAATRVEIAPRVKDRQPERALSFIVENDLAHRPFNTIGFGSFMTWRLYGQRLHFIDGRNFDAGLYRDFLLAQSSRDGLEFVIERYRVDAFIINAVHRSDAGMRNIHEWLQELDGWSLVLVSDLGFVYVADESVPPEFLADHAYRWYHPLSLANRRLSREEIDGIAVDLDRAVAESPDSPRLWLDLALVQYARGNTDAAAQAVERVIALEPGNTAALELRGRLRSSIR
jgi:hypothetical protein